MKIELSNKQIENIYNTLYEARSIFKDLNYETY